MRRFLVSLGYTDVTESEADAQARADRLVLVLQANGVPDAFVESVLDPDEEVDDDLDDLDEEDLDDDELDDEDDEPAER